MSVFGPILIELFAAPNMAGVVSRSEDWLRDATLIGQPWSPDVRVRPSGGSYGRIGFQRNNTDIVVRYTSSGECDETAGQTDLWGSCDHAGVVRAASPGADPPTNGGSLTPRELESVLYEHSDVEDAIVEATFDGASSVLSARVLCMDASSDEVCSLVRDRFRGSSTQIELVVSDAAWPVSPFGGFPRGIPPWRHPEPAHPMPHDRARMSFQQVSIPSAETGR